VVVWQKCSRRIQKLALEVSDGNGFLQQLIAKLDAEELVEVLTVERLIWLHRNSFVFSSDFTPPLHLVMSAKEMVETYKQVNRWIASSAGTQESIHKGWHKPPMGWIKMNWDAALDKTVRKMGVGVVARYDCANVLVAMAMVIPYINDSAAAKSLAVWRVVNMCSELGFQHVVFEGDSLLVVLALSTDSPYWSSFEQVIEDTRLQLLNIPFVEVRHICKDANQVTYTLAKTSLKFLLDCVWIYECLPASIILYLLSKVQLFDL
jgi:hypothetical protein